MRQSCVTEEPHFKNYHLVTSVIDDASEKNATRTTVLCYKEHFMSSLEVKENKLPKNGMATRLSYGKGLSTRGCFMMDLRGRTKGLGGSKIAKTLLAISLVAENRFF